MDKLRKNFLFLILIALNFFSCFFLCIYSLPSKIPTLLDFNEKIVCLGSKWLMMLTCAIPTIFGILALAFEKKINLSKFFKSIFYLSLYENMLLFICFSLSGNIEIGKQLDVPVTAFVFLPASIFIIFYGLKLKHIPYKSNFGVKLKSTLSNEFIWKQEHLYASNIIAGTGLILFLISVVLSFFHYFYITLSCFILFFIIDFVAIYLNANSMFKKYNEMKARQEKINNEKQISKSEKK